MPLSEAATKLQERISGANEIGRPDSRSGKDADAATVERREKKWGDYNIHMLREMFTSDEYADEYARSMGPCVCS
jgi:hypothetical protein